jgi:hypothetical protein
VARLPAIFAMRGMEASLTPAVENDPMLWFLHNSASFYREYTAYRDALAAFIRADPSLLAGLPATTPLKHLLGLNHATLFGRAVDVGMINHQAQLLLGEPLPPIRSAPQWPGWRTPEPGDVIHYSQRADRHYVWRHSVMRPSRVTKYCHNPRRNGHR